MRRKNVAAAVAAACFILQAVAPGCRPARTPATESKLAQGNVNAPADPARADAVNPRPETTLAEFITQIGFLRGSSREGVLSAWEKVPGHENFRVALADDFKLPHAGGAGYSPHNPKSATGPSYEWGEMSGNYGDNLAIILVDKTKPDPNRFGLALFVERESKRYSFYWVFRDRDLSRVTVNRHSGNVYLEEFRADGTRAGYCDIGWSRRRGRWACEL